MFGIIHQLWLDRDIEDRAFLVFVGLIVVIFIAVMNMF